MSGLKLNVRKFKVFIDLEKKEIKVLLNDNVVLATKYIKLWHSIALLVMTETCYYYIGDKISQFNIENDTVKYFSSTIDSKSTLKSTVTTKLNSVYNLANHTVTLNYNTDEGTSHDAYHNRTSKSLFGVILLSDNSFYSNFTPLVSLEKDKDYYYVTTKDGVQWTTKLSEDLHSRLLIEYNNYYNVSLFVVNDFN